MRACAGLRTIREDVSVNPSDRTVVALALSLLMVAGPSCGSVRSSTPTYQKELQRGLYQMQKKDYESAVASFTQVLRDNPDVYDAYLNRASARMEINDLDGALSDFNQAVKINPNVVESFIKRGDLEVKLGSLDAAIADYTQAIRLSPKNTSAYQKRAAAYKLSGQFVNASNDYSSVIKFAPGSIEAWQERADCRRLAGNLDGAVDDYAYLLKKYKPKVAHLNYKLGEVLLVKGDGEKAREKFEEAIAHHSKNLNRTRKNGADYLNRGLAYSRIGENDKALSDLEEAVAWKPEDAVAQYHLGRLKLAKKDHKGAIAAFTAALRSDPKYGAALMDRALAYIAEGEYAPAEKDLNAALDAEKTADGYLSRAMARVSLGDSSGAAADAQEAKLLNAKAVSLKKEQLAQAIAKKEEKKENDLELAQLLIKEALLEMTENNADAAELLIKRAIGIEEKALSKSDPKLTYSLMLLGRAALKKKSPARAEALFRAALMKLQNNTDGAQKYAIFNLEDLARILLQTANQEEAGAILIDTRMARAVSSMNERAYTGEMSRKADRAIEAFKRKRSARQHEEQRQQAAEASVPSHDELVTLSSGDRRQINKPIRDKWAVIVGISTFKDSNINLHFCAKDAQDFYDFLVKEKNFAPDHVQLLTDSSATRANILSLLGNKWLPRVAEPDDLVVIYFSSHGSPSSLDVGGVNYLVAYDTDVNDLYATGIAMQDLSRIIKERVHCERVMLLLDACHSGVAAPSSKGLIKSSNVNVDSIVQGTGQLVLSSSSPEQRSWESKRYQGSVFTRHLIEGLRRNGMMTKLGAAFAYLNEEVQREVLRDRGVLQNPIMKSKWEGDDLIIGVKPAAPSRAITDFELPDAVKPKASTAKHAK